MTQHKLALQVMQIHVHVCYLILISIGRGQRKSPSLIRGLERMKEQELLDLLSQYESEEKFNCVPSNTLWVHVRKYTT